MLLIESFYAACKGSGSIPLTAIISINSHVSCQNILEQEIESLNTCSLVLNVSDRVWAKCLKCNVMFHKNDRERKRMTRDTGRNQTQARVIIVALETPQPSSSSCWLYRHNKSPCPVIFMRCHVFLVIKKDSATPLNHPRDRSVLSTPHPTAPLTFDPTEDNTLMINDTGDHLQLCSNGSHKCVCVYLCVYTGVCVPVYMHMCECAHIQYICFWLRENMEKIQKRQLYQVI